jgi:hypothetical protein
MRGRYVRNPSSEAALSCISHGCRTLLSLRRRAEGGGRIAGYEPCAACARATSMSSSISWG